MNSMLSKENEHPSTLKQKLRGKKSSGEKEEIRSFLKISRDDLNVTKFDIEQNRREKSRCFRNKQTALTALAILLATTCVAVEIWKLCRVIKNTKEIEMLREDIETLKYKFLGDDLFRELKTFKEKLYAEDDNNDSDVEGTGLEDDYSYDDDTEYQTSDYESSAENTEVASSTVSSTSFKQMLTTLQDTRNKTGDAGKSENSSHMTQKRSPDNEDSVAYAQDKELARELSHLSNQSRTDSFFSSAQSENKAELVASSEDDSSFRKFDKVTNKRSRRDKQGNRIKSESQMKGFTRNNKQETGSTTRLRRREMQVRHLRAAKQMCAVHYGADSTLFSNEDEHTGNGRAKHNAGIFKAWKPSEWVQELAMNRYFALSSDGKLTVHEPGLYLIYAQIHYLDEHDENGFHVLVNGRAIFQCLVYSPGFGHKSRSCFSAQATVLKAGDHIVLKDVASARYTLFQKDKSFFGLVKLGDWRQSQRLQTQQQNPQI